MSRILVTGTGLFTPPDGVTNAELVESLRVAVEQWNLENAEAIERGEVEERGLRANSCLADTGILPGLCFNSPVFLGYAGWWWGLDGVWR